VTGIKYRTVCSESEYTETFRHSGREKNLCETTDAKDNG